MAKAYCFGGFREVGKNSVVIESNSTRIMFDSGIKVETDEPPIFPKFKVNGIFITHGHLDHLGTLPVNLRRSKCSIYGTAPTLEQAQLLLKDSIKVARIKGRIPRFSKNDLPYVKKNWKIIKYNQEIRVGKLKIEAVDAGHIPGSAMFIIQENEKKFVYTGDIKLTPTQLTEGARLEKLKGADVVFLETTYSSREHPPREKVEKEFFEVVETTIGKGGIALIPSFALRAAEILMVLSKFKADFPIYLDGMAKDATGILLSHPGYLRNSFKLQKAVKDVKMLFNNYERNKALREPCAIVTTGGCLEGGPIVKYIKHLYADPKNSLILTGYQIPNTAGRYLLDTGRFVNEEVDLKIKMPIHQFDFSSHAGRKELLSFVKKIKPKEVVCMHGEHCQRFATELRGRFGIKAIAPKNGDILTI